MGILGNILSDKLVSRKARTHLFRSWGAAMGMLPVGGPSIWGNATWSPEDTPEMTQKGVSLGCAMHMHTHACMQPALYK